MCSCLRFYIHVEMHVRLCRCRREFATPTRYRKLYMRLTLTLRSSWSLDVSARLRLVVRTDLPVCPRPVLRDLPMDPCQNINRTNRASCSKNNDLIVAESIYIIFQWIDDDFNFFEIFYSCPELSHRRDSNFLEKIIPCCLSARLYLEDKNVENSWYMKILDATKYPRIHGKFKDAHR